MTKNKPLSTVRTWLRKVSTRNVLLLIVSFLIALFAWAYIASSIATDYSKSFSNIAVKIDTAGTKAESYKLSVLDSPESLTVNATIKGNRTDIGGLNKTDLEAYVDFSSAADTIGPQTFPIRLRKIDGTAFTVAPTLSVSSIELTMDKFETQVFEVSAVSHPKITPENDEVTINENKITCNPSSISIYGPSSQLKLIDHICVNVTDEESISKNKTYTDVTDTTLIDADGNVISDKAFQVFATSFSVYIPVYYTHKLPLTVDLPDIQGFDKDVILSRLRLNQKYTLPGYEGEHLSITLETDDPDKKAELDNRTSWSLGTILPSQLTISGKPIEKTFQTDSDYTDRSNIGTVYITLDETDLVAAQRRISNSAISVINGSSAFTYEVQSGWTNVTIVGTAEEVTKVSSDDLQATVDLINASITEDVTKPLAVNITLPDTVSGVWVSPTPTVNIKFTFPDED